MKNSYGCLLIAVCVITVLLGVAKPIFFVVPVAIIVGVIIYEITLIDKKNALVLNYTNSVNEEIIAKNSGKLLGIFNEITQKYKSDSKVVFENTYDHFLSTAFSSDFPNKKEVLFCYKENLERALFVSHTKD